MCLSSPKSGDLWTLSRPLAFACLTSEQRRLPCVSRLTTCALRWLTCGAVVPQLCHESRVQCRRIIGTHGVRAVAAQCNG